ncbi:alpha/beta hydrolase [Spirosoma arcticum]
MTGNEPLILRVTTLEDHPADEPIFLAGDINDWQPNDERFRLITDPADGVHTLRIPAPPSRIVYKFTRGSWACEERNAQGGPIDNRTWEARSDGPLVYARIAGWRDWPDRMAIELEEVNVYVWHDALWMPSLQRHRRIWVYLPPDYDKTDRHYPVLYMHDAQNLFVNAASPYEKWQVARTLNRLAAETNWGCLVVGIEHGETERLAEYSPVANPQHGGGDGGAYLTFLLDTLKPLTDTTFRTRPDAANTVMVGSSMGGLISVYAALRHGNVFGKVAAFSPSLWWSDDVYALAAAAPYNFVHKLALLGGEQESETMLPDLLALYYTLVDNGYYEHKIQFDFYRDGTHTEHFWGRELERAIRWLFSEELGQMPDQPAAVLDESTRELRLLKPFVRADLLNGYGKVIFTLDGSVGDRIPIQPHWRGLFALKCLLPDQRIELKKVIL